MGSVAQIYGRGTDGTGATFRAADGTNGTAEYARNATGGTNGATQAGTHEGRTRVARSSVHAEEAITPEPSTDHEVNGPYWDSHVVDMVPESDDATNRRTRLMHQAIRRVIRGRNAEHQALIIALQNQVDRKHDRAVALSQKLERFHAGARQVYTMQKAHRDNRVLYMPTSNRA